MWIRLISVGFAISLFFCGQQTVRGKANSGEKCFESSGISEVSKVSYYFDIPIDEVEKQGVGFYFLINPTSIVFLFHSLQNKVTFSLLQIDQNVYLVPEKKVFIGIKYSEDKARIWIEKDKDKLFKDYASVGYTRKDISPDICFDKQRIKSLYEDRKRE